MIKVYQENCINLFNVSQELGMKIRDFEFAYLANNDSFVTLGLTDADLEELWAKIEYEIEYKEDEKRKKRLENEYALINLLRAMGYRGHMIVFISW